MSQSQTGIVKDSLKDCPAFTLETIRLREEIMAGKMVHHTTLSLGHGYRVEVREGLDSLWLLIKRNGSGGLALRTAYAPGPSRHVEFFPGDATHCEFHLASSIGAFRVKIGTPDSEQPVVRVTVSLIPSADLLLPYWPRDLYPIDAQGDPTTVGGVVEAAQRGYNSGIVYARMEQPSFGSFLYFQNLTTLNDYFLTTGTKPDGVVGGDWPELGYRMPVSEERPLRAGKEIILSDVFLNFTPEQDTDERHTARRFLDMLAGIYRHLDRPNSEFHPWPRRAEETLRDLSHSPKATIKEHGYVYLHPYTGSEYPDSMVQLTVLTAMKEYGRWKKEPLPFADDLRASVPRFFDREIGTMRRYLPSVGDDKDSEAVDSWYMYHPLVNLARLAQEEDDAEARDLFLMCLPHAIKVAQHFDYQWPVMFNVRTLEVIKQNRKPDELGQTDVGGLYAHVMTQAYTLTGDRLYLEEAKNGIRATEHMRFNLVYQTNTTAYGLTSCLKLWELTGEEFFRDQAYVFLAGYFHNSIFWESCIENARHYQHFMAATCLHDGPYMAPYECFESFSAFHKALEIARDDLPDSVSLLLAEFSKYALGRLWYFYPDNLPADTLATEIRNGKIDRLLTFPLEDLYVDGQPAGQVGQEIYGCGAAFALSVRAFHRIDGAPFLFYCEYPCEGFEEVPKREGGGVAFRVQGVDGFTCKARAIATGDASLPVVNIDSEQGETLNGIVTGEGHCEFTLAANQMYRLYWETEER